LINGEPIATDNEAPYTFTNLTTTIQNLSHETHYLQAIATDNDGNTSLARIAILGGDPPPPNEDEEEHGRLEIRAYPNPIQNGELTIEMIQTGSYAVRIIDLNGREVDRFIFSGTVYQHIFEKSIAKGMYMLEVKEAEEILFKNTFIIQ
ncbi:MAG: T9SS type A sorting domain-containing protein, partial [Bacteroidia bacterium]